MVIPMMIPLLANQDLTPMLIYIWYAYPELCSPWGCAPLIPPYPSDYWPNAIVKPPKTPKSTSIFRRLLVDIPLKVHFN